jgi:succinyl-diaminopimelate desuccinylase
MPEAVARNLADPVVRKALEAGLGSGAADTVAQVTLNIGMVEGGLKMNMIPSECRIEADIRLPWGIAPEEMVKRVAAIVASHDGARMHVISEQTPRWSDPTHPMVGHIRRNAAEVAGWRVLPIPSLAGTDARLWRERGIPAFTYGTTATNVAMPDERTDIAEWLRVVRVHALSALDYLT